MSLTNLRVSPEDIDTEYHPIHQRLVEFKDLVRFCRNNSITSPADVTRKKGLSRTKDKRQYEAAQPFYKRWIIENDLPYSVQAIFDLVDLGLFPLAPNSDPSTSRTEALAKEEVLPFTYSNPRIKIASIIGSAGFWRGYVPAAGTQTGEITIHYQFQGSGIDNLLSTWIQRTVYTADRDQRIQLNAALSKFLRILGGYRGRKVRMEQAFPTPVEAALASWKKSNNSLERQIAFQIITDFILTFFAGDKVKHSAHRGFSAVFPFTLQRDIADRRVELFHEALRITRSEIKTLVSAAHQNGDKGRKHMTYSHIIQFPNLTDLELQKLRGELRENIDFCIAGI